MKNKEGIILIFVLWILTTFSLMGLGLAFRVRIENKLSKYFAAEYENLYLAKSKLNQVMNEIIQDNNNYDSFEEEWAINTLVDTEEGGSLKMTVEDEDGKLNINTATSEWLSNFLLISETVKDQIIENRPFLVVEEMLYIEGVEDYFYSTKEKKGFLDLLSTQNDGKMNVNTIRKEVLYSMPGISISCADAILSLRENETIDDIEIFKDVAGISRNEFQILNQILKTTSDFYTVKIQIDNRKNKINKSYRITLKKDLENKTVGIVRWLEQ